MYGNWENLYRICNHLGFANAVGQRTGVNGSPEAVVDADMNGFTLVSAGDDREWMECF